MNKWKKRVLIIAGILLVVAMIATPTVLLLTRMSGEEVTEEEVRQQELRFAFIERYGTEARLIEIVEPESLYIYIWEESEGGTVIRHFTLSINGLFVELGQVEVGGE